MKEQLFDEMPSELLDQSRWFPVGEDKKPHMKDWSNPDKQRPHTDCKPFAGFDICGHGRGDDYCLFDFDNVRDENGYIADEMVRNFLAHVIQYHWYFELSISGRGFHVLFKPTPGAVERILKSILHVDGKKITNKKGLGVMPCKGGGKLEIFYLEEGRYCWLTGNQNIGGNPPQGCIVIPDGKEADNMLITWLAEIRDRTPALTPEKQPARGVESRARLKVKPPMRGTYHDTDKYKRYRVPRMCDAIPIAHLQGTDWLVAMTALKAIGFSYEEADRYNIGGEKHDEEENRRRWDSLDPVGDWLGALYNLAVQYGYDEADTRRKWKEENPSTPAQFHILPDEQAAALYGGGSTDVDFADRLAFLFADEVKFLKPDGLWYIRECNEFGGAVWKCYGEKKFCLYPFVYQLALTLIGNAVKIPAELDGCKVIKQKTPKGVKYTLAPKKAVDGEGSAIDLAAHKEPLEKLGAIVEKHNFQEGLGRKLKMMRNASSAIEAFKGSEEIAITAEDLNRHTFLLNVLNGVVDLQTGKLYRQDEGLQYLPTNQFNAVYDTNCACDFVENFFAQILPDPDTCAAVLRFLGYALSGDKPYHVAEFWRGTGANGKSTLLDFLFTAFADYAVKLPNLALIQSSRLQDANAATPALASLGGDVRLALVDELPRGVRLNADLFKQITGDKTARARFLHQNPITIELRAKLILNGNFNPDFDVDDGGLRRRITRVNFTQHFEAAGCDPLLPQKLATPENRSALLFLLTREARLFYEEGLLESNAMAEAKADYFNENDFVTAFIDENLLVGEGGRILRKTLEEKICAAFPADTRRLKKKELFNLLLQKLEPLGAVHKTVHSRVSVFENVKFVEAE